MSAAYDALLARPEWKLRRLEILERDNFTCRKCNVSGGELHVHHEYYARGAKPWDYPDNALTTLCTRCHFKVTEERSLAKQDLKDPEGAAVRQEVGKLIGMVANHLAVHRATPPLSREFDRERAWRWIQRFRDERVHRPLMKFASWLWSTGSHDMDVLMAILEDRCRRNPDNPYAYYAPGGIARDCRSAKASIEIGERENASFKQADREFLSHKQKDQRLCDLRAQADELIRAEQQEKDRCDETAFEVKP